MTRFNIQIRIWLSIGIFVAGFLLTTIVSQVERRLDEQRLGSIAEATFPAAQRGRDAETGFERVVRAYSDAFLVEDRSGLDRADTEGFRVVEALNEIAASGEIPQARIFAARNLAGAVRNFLLDANSVYAAALARKDAITPEMQRRVRRLANRTNQLKSELQRLQVELVRDLQGRMDEMRTRSARMRVFLLSVFGATLALATVLVNLTIRRSILVPLAAAQAELAHERDLLRILMENIPDAIFFKDAGSRYLRINKAYAAVLGLQDPAEACGRSDADFFDPEFAGKTRADEQWTLQTGEPLLSSMEQITRVTPARWVTTTKVRVRDEARNANLIVGISRDVTEWQEAVAALERSETSFRLLFSAVPHAVWVCDVGTHEILEVNEAAVQRYGYSAEEFRGMRINEIYPQDDQERLDRVLATLDPSNLPRGARKHIAKDGRTLETEIIVHLLELHNRRAILIMAQDVTERNRLELELQHAQRMEAVGQLAAGIAHEINTPIQFVGDNLRFMRDAFRDREGVMAKYMRLHQAVLGGEDVRGVLEELQTKIDQADMDYLASEVPDAIEQSLGGVDRVATIVRAMKAFAHPGQKEKAAADLNKALQDALIVARNEVKYVADIVTDYGDLPPVVCHLADLNQVFLNLLVNAAHAIGEVTRKSGGKGQIGVKTRRDGDQVVVSISDTGCGIPEAIRQRIFDPFFTTKEVGRGTGQGLSLARSIVEKHAGRIAFEPNMPQGTVFSVYLPIDPPRPAAPPESEAVLSGGVQ